MIKEEIAKALRACGEMDCSPCKYRRSKEPFCIDALIRDTTNLIEAQAAEIEKLKSSEVPRWIPVRERIPPDQEEVLVLTRSKNGVRNVDKGYWAIDHFIHRGRSEVTHWMPLPGVEV